MAVVELVEGEVGVLEGVEGRIGDLWLLECGYSALRVLPNGDYPRLNLWRLPTRNIEILLLCCTLIQEYAVI